MISLIFTAEKFQIGAGLSGYIAELGAAFLSADLGILVDVRDDHAAYISEWIKVLKGDKRAIVQAASHAERAVTYLHSFQPDASSPAEEAEAA